MVIKAPHF